MTSNTVNQTYDHVNYAIQRMQGLVDQSTEALAKFATEFSKNPAQALSWSLSAFYHANQQSIAKSVVQKLVKDPTQENIDRICQYMLENLIQLCRNTPSSTSQTANLMENSKREATLQVLDFLTAYKTK